MQKVVAVGLGVDQEVEVEASPIGDVDLIHGTKIVTIMVLNEIMITFRRHQRPTSSTSSRRTKIRS